MGLSPFLAALTGLLCAAFFSLTLAGVGTPGDVVHGVLSSLFLVLAVVMVVRGFRDQRVSKKDSGQAFPSAADAARRRLWRQ